jgi:SAM-dependent methyltransferase
MERYSEYDPFAAIYNRHWGYNFIPLILPILEKHLLDEVPAGGAILDLCCGTGQLAKLLSDRGYRVTGLDGSGEMLHYAGENAPGTEFILDDARSFSLPGRFDAVISVFDSLNHVMTIGELASVFRNVCESLKPGGLFLFDLNMAAGFRTSWHDEFSIIEDDNVCVLRSNYNPEEKAARFVATIFTLDNGWQRTDLTLLQKCYTAEEVLEALRAAGFKEADAYSCDILQGLVGLTGDAERAFFIGRRPSV